MATNLKIDLTETEVGAAWYVDDNIFSETTGHTDCLVVVSGPDADGEICILAGAETYLSVETAKALAIEILKRLQIRPLELEY